MKPNKNKATLESAENELQIARRELSLSIQKGNEKIRAAVRKCLNTQDNARLFPSQGS